MSQYPRLIWGDNDEYYLDFTKNFNGFDDPRYNLVLENRSLSGITEHLEMYQDQNIMATMNYVKPQEVESLRNFYEYAKDGSPFTLLKDRDLVAYLPFEGQKTDQDGNDLNILTSANRHFINPDTGKVQVIAANDLLLPGGKYGRGVQLEQSTVNLLANTEDFSHADWVKNGCTVSANYSSIKDPEGGTTADKVNFGYAGHYVRQTTTETIGTNNGTFSVWIYFFDDVVQHLKLDIQRDDTYDILASQTITASAGWNRYSVSYINSGSIAAHFVVRVYETSSTTAYNVMLWGAQFETNAFMSAYITSGTGNDSVYLDVSDYEMLARKGTIACWVCMPQIAGVMGYMPDRYFWYIQDAGLDPKIFLNINASDQLEFKITDMDGTGTLAILGDSSSTLNKDQWHHLAVTWNLDSGLRQIFLDGTRTVYAQKTMPTCTNLPDKLYLGHRLSSEPFSFRMDDFLVRQDELTDMQINWIYRKGRALGIQKNKWTLELSDKSFNPVRQIAAEKYSFTLNAREVLT